ncbi:hypothetical protein RYX36_016587 [Vicia faba]
MVSSHIKGCNIELDIHFITVILEVLMVLGSASMVAPGPASYSHNNRSHLLGGSRDSGGSDGFGSHLVEITSSYYGASRSGGFGSRRALADKAKSSGFGDSGGDSVSAVAIESLLLSFIIGPLLIVSLAS